MFIIALMHAVEAFQTSLDRVYNTYESCVDFIDTIKPTLTTENSILKLPDQILL